MILAHKRLGKVEFEEPALHGELAIYSTIVRVRVFTTVATNHQPESKCLEPSRSIHCLDLLMHNVKKIKSVVIRYNSSKNNLSKDETNLVVIIVLLVITRIAVYPIV